jgi:hypothetical protein
VEIHITQGERPMENEIMELSDVSHPTNTTNDDKILELSDNNQPEGSLRLQNNNKEEDFDKLLKKELEQKTTKNREIPTKTPQKRGGAIFGKRSNNNVKEEKNMSESTKKKKNYGNYLVIGSIIGIIGSYLMN